MSLLGLCSALLACSGRADIPDTPDLTVMQSEFDNPTAVLDETTVGEAIQVMPSLRQLAAAFRATGANTTGGVEKAGGEAKTGSRLDIQGSIQIAVRCPGELDVPAYGQNGAISMTLGVERNLIKRGIALRATDCVLRGYAVDLPIRVEVDGPIYVDLGRDIGLRQRWSGRILMWVAGTLKVDGLVLEDLAARWTTDSLEYLYRLPDGKVIIATLTTEGNLSVKDSRVTWGCSDGQACAPE